MLKLGLAISSPDETLHRLSSEDPCWVNSDLIYMHHVWASTNSASVFASHDTQQFKEFLPLMLVVLISSFAGINP